MTRADIFLPGTPRNASPMRPCQGKCAGAERVPEGGLQLTPTKWVCASCGAAALRRIGR